MSLDDVYRRCDDVRFRVIDGEAVVVRQRAAEVLVVSAVGARMLELADGVTPVRGWLEVLAAEFEVELERLERDVLEFAAELERVQVLEPAEQR